MSNALAPIPSTPHARAVAGMIQATTKLSIKKGKFDEVNQILVEELDAMKSFEGLYDLSVTKVDDQTLMIVATYFSTVELEQCAASLRSPSYPRRSAPDAVKAGSLRTGMGRTSSRGWARLGPSWRRIPNVRLRAHNPVRNALAHAHDCARAQATSATSSSPRAHTRSRTSRSGRSPASFRRWCDVQDHGVHRSQRVWRMCVACYGRGAVLLPVVALVSALRCAGCCLMLALCSLCVYCHMRCCGEWGGR